MAEVSTAGKTHSAGSRSPKASRKYSEGSPGRGGLTTVSFYMY